MILILQIAAGIVLAVVLLATLPIIIKTIKEWFEPNPAVYLAEYEGIKYVKFGKDGHILYSSEINPKGRGIIDQEKMEKILKWKEQ